jgi:outer membrane transport energization protein ExbB (TC 2.C.1.1.1)
MKMFKTLAISAGLGLVALLAPAAAQQQGGVSLQELLRRVQADSAQLSQEAQQRLREFQSAGADERNKLAQITAQVNAEEARGRALGAEFQSNEARLTALEGQLNSQAGDFGELVGQLRQAAGEIDPLIKGSVISAQYPGRAERLSQIAQARRLPTRAELDVLWKVMLQEVIAQGEVTSFTTSAISNLEGEQTVTRIGPFMAFVGNGGQKYLKWNVEAQKLEVIGRQPEGRIVAAAAQVASANDGEFVRGAIDPSRGDLIGLLSEAPDFGERVDQGGIVGYVTLTLGAIGVLLGLYKIVTLFLTQSAVSATARSKQGGAGNPLARIFSAYETTKSSDVETIELKLDEAILRETPKLEFGNDIIKVLANVAPLLGLLGTVIGMIITFTQITLFGAGDPKTMAGGISTALVTTVQGLVVAIPLVLLHAVVSGQSRAIQQVLDEQSAGLVAQRMESEARGAKA